MSDIKKLKKFVREVLNEGFMDSMGLFKQTPAVNELDNYPAGAEHHPQAPWNEPDSPKPNKYTKVADLIYFDGEIAIFKDKLSGENYVYNIEANEDESSVEEYINTDWYELSKGEGIMDLESGQFDLVKIDDAVKQDLARVFNPKIADLI